MKKFFVNLILLVCPLISAFSDERELRAFYNSLDPNSLSQLLAFYQLYPHAKEGQGALQKACLILNRLSHSNGPLTENISFDVNLLSQQLIHAIMGFTEQAKIADCKLGEKELLIIDRWANGLSNRKLKGYKALTEKQVLSLPANEIDLGRALLLSQIGSDEKAMQQIASYEAMLDVMSLQILAKLPLVCTAEEKIMAINEFIFEQMHFRFPPQSQYAKDIDLYTFLPSVLDQHLGVCLGVTTIYICIAQRLDLPLEIITPPGHIYVRYKDPLNRQKREINIETTARGVDMPTDTYLSVNTGSLDIRTIKEVVGMTHINQASIYLHNKSYEKAVQTYEKAVPYMPDDPMLNELLGYSYLLSGNIQKGEALLKKVAWELPESSFVRENIIQDYLEGLVDLKGVEAVLMYVDSDRESILKKLQALQCSVEKFPNFRAGWQQLGVAWLQLNRSKEALDALMRYHEIDGEDPTVEYYLSVLHAQRLNFNQSWLHLSYAEQATKKRGYLPKVLKEVRQELIKNCPP